jgi:hypothetical protein
MLSWDVLLQCTKCPSGTPARIPSQSQGRQQIPQIPLHPAQTPCMGFACRISVASLDSNSQLQVIKV